MYIINNKK